MPTLDAKRLWISYGYGLHNEFERSISFVRNYGLEKKIPAELVDLTMIEFFMELNEEPEKYRFENNVCPCGCGIDKSGTAAVHEMIKRLDNVSYEFVKNFNDLISKQFNDKIAAYIAKQDEAFIKENSVSWIDKNLPTFKRWFSRGDKSIRNPNTRSDA